MMLDVASAADVDEVAQAVAALHDTTLELAGTVATLTAPPLLMTRREMIRWSGLPGASIDQLVGDGVLRWHTIGKSRRLARADLEDHLEQLRRHPVPSASPSEPPTLRAV